MRSCDRVETASIEGGSNPLTANIKKISPVFETREEYEEALPALLRLAEKYRRLAWSQQIDGDEVKSRMLLRYELYWTNIPKQEGQKAYVGRIFRSSVADHLKYQKRSLISPEDSALFDDRCLRRLAGSPPEFQQHRCELDEAMHALDSLETEFGYCVIALRERETSGATVKSLAEKYHCAPNTLRRGFGLVKKTYRERFPQFRELVKNDGSGDL